MNPARWERMSWHARHQYLTTLTAREEWIERQTHRLSIERERWTRQAVDPMQPPPRLPLIPPGMSDINEMARWIYWHLKSDPAELIEQRRDELIHNTIHNQI